MLKAGVVYAFNAAASIYANYSEPQRQDVNDPDFSTVPPVRIGEQAEAGFRLSLFDHRLDATVAYFRVEEELNGEATRPAEADGFEVDVRWLPIDEWSLMLSHTNTETVLDLFATYDLDNCQFLLR